MATYTESLENGRPCFPSHLVKASCHDSTTSAVAIVRRPPKTTPVAPARYTIAERAAREMALRRQLLEDSPQPLVRHPEVIQHIHARYRDGAMSVTALQTFQTCPFTFYARYLLGIGTNAEESVEVDGRTRGDLLHASLTQLYRDHLETIRSLNLDTPKDRQHLTDCIHKVLAQTTAEQAEALEAYHPCYQTHGSSQLADMIAMSVSEDIRLWQRLGDRAPQPVALEWAFGRGDDAPMTLRDGDRTVDLCGQIDRVDIIPATQELIVVDYKTGRAASISGALKSGTHLQIPLYLLAYTQRMPNLAPAGGLLFHVRSNTRCHGLIRRDLGKALYGISGRKRSSVTAEQLDEALSLATQQAITIADNIRSGTIPGNAHTCQFCDWQELSRREVT
jgi:ATP-dependent helicase/DNAse subunit B